MDRIHITNIEVEGFVGIKPEEQTHRQAIRVNVTLWVDIAAAAASDDIADAVNYRTVTKAVVAHVEAGRPLLVERLAQELADVCLTTDDRIGEVEISVEKPDALRDAQSVGVIIHRRRNPGSA